MKKKIFNHSYLNLKDNTKLCFFSSNQSKNKLGIIFLSGHGSDMEGTKAQAIQKLTYEKKIPFVKFDYYGHGKSDGNLKDGNISRWKSDCINIIREVCKGPQIIVGSSLGGWIMFLVASELKSQIHGLIGIAAAPDFTQNLIWNKLSKSKQKEFTIRKKIFIENPYSTEKIEYPLQLINDGKKNLILEKNIDLDIPIVLLHGMKDNEVPWETCIKISQKLKGKDLKIILKKNSEHRFSEESEITLIQNEVLKLHARLFNDL